LSETESEGAKRNWLIQVNALEEQKELKRIKTDMMALLDGDATVLPPETVLKTESESDDEQGIVGKKKGLSERYDPMKKSKKET